MSREILNEAREYYTNLFYFTDKEIFYYKYDQVNNNYKLYICLNNMFSLFYCT